MSREQVAKNPCDKIWKFCLNVFHNWKVHSQVSRDRSRQTFWVNLATGASTREPVTNMSRENPKTQIFEIFLSVPLKDMSMERVRV